MDNGHSGKSAFDRFGFYVVPDLTEEERQPPEFIVDGMIPCGLSFLSGAPKIRKSFMALQMVAAVATGKPFLGHTTTKCDAVYFDLEGSKSRISTRAARMSTPIPSNVYVSNRLERRLANGLVNDLRDLHRQRPGIRFIVLDTYSRARGNVRSTGANAYDSDVLFLEPLQRMAIDEKIAVLCIHHDRKNAALVSDDFERLSGTMGLSGSCDSVINLVCVGKRFDGRATLTYTPRDARGGEINLVFDERFCEWQQIAGQTNDIERNPVAQWIIRNAPDPKENCVFIPYNTICQQTGSGFTERPGDFVRDQVIKCRDDLFKEKGIAVQTGATSHGNRGVRILRI